MKKLFLIALLSVPLSGVAQFTQIGIGGKYLYSARWDRMVQTYNFSRPHLTNMQPLLQYGGSVSVTRWFRNSGKINHGLHSEAVFVTSYADNSSLRNRINLTLLTAGYGLHIPTVQMMSNTYLDLIASAEGSLFSRRVNGEALIIDDKRSAAFGIGCNIQFRFGYVKALSETVTLTPFAGGAFSPFHYSPETEVLINQTMGLFEETSSALWSVQIGMGIQIHSKNSITP